MRFGAFEVTAVDDLNEYSSAGIRLVHKPTGMDVYHIHNEDTENLFAYVFKTPPSDDTGAPHIIEHAVLAGSSKYPVKDPFLSLMKGSVNTFLNAMTYPDKTVYPSASPVKEDFFNLLSVYSDAVFRPLLKKEIFHQEGRRYEFDESGILDVTGVVYNEMKGALSSFESAVADHSFRSLFPDSIYRYESGGEPEAIRELTYEDFLAFYKRYYHPSNCRLFLYGDIPTEEILEKIEPYVSGYEPLEEPADIARQPKWDAPKTFFFEGPSGEDAGEKTTFTINWRLMPLSDPVEVLSFELVSEILLGNQGSPMYKALYESPYGEDLSPACGIDTDLQDLVFSLGVRGAETKDRDAFTEYVFAQLSELVKNGVDKDIIEGSVNRVEFRNREIKGGIPFGLRLMGKSLRGWLHGLAPDATLGFERYMEEIKRRYQADPRYFEKLIDQHIIGNTHYAVVTVEPSSAYQKKKDEAHLHWRKRKTAALSDAERGAIAADMKVFEEFQKTPDTPEDAATIPSLSLTDIPKTVRTIDNTAGSLSGRPFFTHEVFTNGIIYADFAFEIPELSREQEFLLPLFAKVLTAVGVGDLSYDQAATKLSLISGGVYSFIEISNNLKSMSPKAYFFMRAKSVMEKYEDVLEFIADILTKGHIEDRKRIKDLLIEYRNELRTSVVSAGHSFALLRAASKISGVLKREEQWRGIEQFLYINELAASVDSKMDGIISVFKSLKDTLLTKAVLSMNLTCEKSHMQKGRDAFAAFLDRLPDGTHASAAAVSREPETDSRYEAFSVPSTVNYVAAVVEGSILSQKEYAYESLLSHLLKTEQLWEKIRMQGGAYGAFASVNGTEGLFSLGSYRDPNVAKTYRAFDEAFDDLCAVITEESLEKAKITLLGKEFKPLSPGEQSMIGFRRDLFGIDDDMRQFKHGCVYDASVEDIRRCALRIKKNLAERGISVVVGAQGDLEKAAAEMNAFKDRIFKLL